ncbi:MAG: hypothetical protein HY236_10525, partial [Acidobacteria bacterium]|nr:hypothetical protein [Acidobacteriota bacterium]
MKRMNRRSFFKGTGLVLGAAAAETARPGLAASGAPQAQIPGTPVDFRYAPLSWQTAFCFPDDPHKSLAGERGELRYGHPGQGKGADYFPTVVEFSLRGMETNQVVRQELEAPAVPIIHTRIDRAEAFLELTTFASNDPGEGRVDNVMLEVRARTRERIRAAPLVVLKTRQEARVRNESGRGQVRLGGEGAPLFLASSSPLRGEDAGREFLLAAKEATATGERPLRCFFRFPQEGQSFERIQAGLDSPERLLEQARQYWQRQPSFGGKVRWKLAGQHDHFLAACARNILQAREVSQGRLIFQVGPTVYRGLWVVDGNFILEAARYLGYDAEVQQGLEATWARQQSDGGIFAGGGKEHWKDTGIAMFTLVRQAELSQDWSYFRAMQPNVLK